MGTKVLDSWALLAFYKDEPCAAEVEKLIHQAADKGKPLLLSVINWTEIHYSLERAGGKAVAERVAEQIAELPIQVVGVGDDLKTARTAAAFKASNKMSLADAFAAALAKENKAELVTGDPELKALEGRIKIHWLKR
ncbi:MAG: PIN domain-containing protein [Chthoniobacterales bacterium]